MLSSTVNGSPFTLDQMEEIARPLNLPGEVSIHLPKSPESVFSVSNQTSDLSATCMVHFDQYSGEQLLAHTWSDIGFLMQGRLWVMAFHHGEFGPWNWYLMLFIAFMLITMRCSAIYFYILRKKKGSWSVPNVPARFRVGGGVIMLMVILGVILPLFGASVLIIIGSEWLLTRKKKRAYVERTLVEASGTG